MKLRKLKYLALAFIFAISSCGRSIDNAEMLGTYIFNYEDIPHESLSDTIFIREDFNYKHIAVFLNGSTRKTYGKWEKTERGVCFTDFKFFIPGFGTADTTIYGYWCPRVYRNINGEIFITISSDQDFYYKKIPTLQ